MKRAGVADLKLHPGKAPYWLVKRMMPMASALCEFIVDEFGTLELLRRLSDPVYFQALSNVLGYDWDIVRDILYNISVAVVKHFVCHFFKVIFVGYLPINFTPI